MALELKKDDQGNIITKPVMGYKTATLGGVGIMLVIDYANSPEDLGRGEGDVIQFSLTPDQCVELAKSLVRAADVTRKSNAPNAPVH